jgi:hypothetical protein
MTERDGPRTAAACAFPDSHGAGQPRKRQAGNRKNGRPANGQHVLFREDQLASPLPVGYAALISCSCPSCNRMHRESCTSRIARCEVRYDRKKVLLVNICYSLGHQRAPFSRSSAVLEVIELPEHVAR